MRWLWLLLLFGGCSTRPVDLTCSQPISCPGGHSYHFCSTGTQGSCTVGRYLLSDGTSLDCSTCADCQAVAVEVAAWCSSGMLEKDMGAQVDFGSRPDLSASFDLAFAGPDSGLADLGPSQDGGAAVLLIPKSGPPYTGGHTDPGLTDAAQCSDAALEPNDGPAPSDAPLAFTPSPDMPTAKIIKLAICPTGAAPATGRHDQDWFKVDYSGGTTATSLMAEVFYDISFGDLDVAILDEAGNVLAEDGTATTNGCAAAHIGAGVFYVVVTGANNVDVNNYQLLIRSFAANQACPPP